MRICGSRRLEDKVHSRDFSGFALGPKRILRPREEPRKQPGSIRSSALFVTAEAASAGLS